MTAGTGVDQQTSESAGHTHTHTHEPEVSRIERTGSRHCRALGRGKRAQSRLSQCRETAAPAEAANFRCKSAVGAPTRSLKSGAAPSATRSCRTLFETAWYGRKTSMEWEMQFRLTRIHSAGQHLSRSCRLQYLAPEQPCGGGTEWRIYHDSWHQFKHGDARGFCADIKLDIKNGYNAASRAGCTIIQVALTKAVETLGYDSMIIGENITTRRSHLPIRQGGWVWHLRNDHLTGISAWRFEIGYWCSTPSKDLWGPL